MWPAVSIILVILGACACLALGERIHGRAAILVRSKTAGKKVMVERAMY